MEKIGTMFNSMTANRERLSVKKWKLCFTDIP